MRKRALWLNCEVSERWNIQVWTSFVCFFNNLFTKMKKSFRSSTGRQLFWLCLDLFHGEGFMGGQIISLIEIFLMFMFQKTNNDRITNRFCQFNYYCIPSHITNIISFPNLFSVPDSYWQTNSSGGLVFLRRLEVRLFFGMIGKPTCGHNLIVKTSKSYLLHT